MVQRVESSGPRESKRLWVPLLPEWTAVEGSVAMRPELQAGHLGVERGLSEEQGPPVVSDLSPGRQVSPERQGVSAKRAESESWPSARVDCRGGWQRKLSDRR